MNQLLMYLLFCVIPVQNKKFSYFGHGQVCMNDRAVDVKISLELNGDGSFSLTRDELDSRNSEPKLDRYYGSWSESNDSIHLRVVNKKSLPTNDILLIRKAASLEFKNGMINHIYGGTKIEELR